MKNLLLTLLFFFVVTFAHAQSGLGLWSSVAMEKKIGKALSANIVGQARFVENISYRQTSFLDFGLDYKLGKHWEVSANYRLISRRKNETKEFKTRYRYYADLAYNRKIGKLKVEYRFRYQNQFQDNDGETAFDASYFRNKIGLEYPNKSKFTPYVSGDLFYEIGNRFDQLRPKVGTTFKLTKNHSLDASLFTNIDLTGTVAATPIIGLGYKWKW